MNTIDGNFVVNKSRQGEGVSIFVESPQVHFGRI